MLETKPEHDYFKEATKETAEREELLKLAKPKYIYIPDAKKKGKFTKCLRPKEIGVFKYAEGNFLVFGDVRCKPSFYRDMLEECLESNLVILCLRMPNKKDFAFTLPLDQVLKARKYRLSVAIALPDEDENQFMKDELEIQGDISEDELKEDFLSSLEDDLIINDLKRIIMLYYQDSINLQA